MGLLGTIGGLVGTIVAPVGGTAIGATIGGMLDQTFGTKTRTGGTVTTSQPRVVYQPPPPEPKKILGIPQVAFWVLLAGTGGLGVLFFIRFCR